MKKTKNITLSNYAKIRGVKHCYNNAISLKEDAELLIKHKKWPRATALLIIGIEEISKIEMLGQTFFYRTQDEWKNFNRRFTSHNKKLTLADTLLLQIAYRSGSRNNLEEELNELLKGRDLNIGKQKCLYVDYSLKDGWINPNEKVTQEDANDCMTILKSLIKQYESIFSKNHNELVDIIKKMKKWVPDEVVENSLRKMHSDIINTYDRLKSDFNA